MITRRPHSRTATRRAYWLKIRKTPRRQPGRLNGKLRMWPVQSRAVMHPRRGGGSPACLLPWFDHSWRSPGDYATTDVLVQTSPGAAVSATAHYRTEDTTNKGSADSSGAASIPFYTSGATPGY